MTFEQTKEVGKIVYHAYFKHWGKGTVLDWRERDDRGRVTRHRIKVKWEDRPGDAIWMRVSELRLTPRILKKPKMR